MNDDDDDVRRLLPPPPRRRPGPLTLAVRWRVELLVGATVAAACEAVTGMPSAA